MKYFVAIVKSVDNMVERRTPYRQEHLARLHQLKADGKLFMAGAWADTVDGALLIFRADSKEEVERMISEDPYHKAGLWPEYTIREWGVAIQ